MSNNQFDEMKDKVVGEVKETAGEVTDNKELEAKGGLQKGMGEAREMARGVADEVRDVKDTVLGEVKQRTGKFTDDEGLQMKGKLQKEKADSEYTKTIITGLGVLAGASLLKGIFGRKNKK